LAGFVLTVGVTSTVLSVTETPWVKEKKKDENDKGDENSNSKNLFFSKLPSCMTWLCVAVGSSWISMFIFMIYASSWMAVDVYKGQSGGVLYGQGVPIPAST